MAKAKTANREDDILAIGLRDRYQTVDELVRHSQPNSIYYTLLITSSLIVAFGLLLENSAVVIGGMLVTPVLTPVLFVALGIATSELSLIRNVSMLLLRSFAIIFASGLIAAVLFGTSDSISFLDNSANVAILYFFVALLSGMAATFAWARKDVVDILPGVAITVALVPPVVLAGIGVSILDPSLIRFNFLIFLLNILGVTIGSLIIFSLLGFYRTKGKVHREAKKTAEDNGHKARRN